jgi:hypothetical protein
MATSPGPFLESALPSGLTWRSRTKCIVSARAWPRGRRQESDVEADAHLDQLLGAAAIEPVVALAWVSQSSSRASSVREATPVLVKTFRR